MYLYRHIFINSFENSIYFSVNFITFEIYIYYTPNGLLVITQNVKKKNNSVKFNTCSSYINPIIFINIFRLMLKLRYFLIWMPFSCAEYQECVRNGIT